MAFKNNEVQNRYLWGVKQDELLCKNDAWTLSDHLNTVRDVVKSDGSVVKHLEYNAFGECLSVNTSFPRRRESSQNDNELSFAYTGKLFDHSTGLQWNINCWYDAKVGRWASEDPIGFGGKDINIYRTCTNALTGLADPLGLVQIRSEILTGYLACDDTNWKKSDIKVSASPVYNCSWRCRTTTKSSQHSHVKADMQIFDDKGILLSHGNVFSNAENSSVFEIYYVQIKSRKSIKIKRNHLKKNVLC